MAAPPSGQAAPPPNQDMAYRSTSPHHHGPSSPESQRLMAAGGRHRDDDDDDDDDDGRRRRRRRSFGFRFHLVNLLRLAVAFLSVASICLTAGGDTLIPAAIPIFVLGTLAVLWNGVVLFDWAFDCWGRPRCVCLRLPNCLCQFGSCRVGCGSPGGGDDDGDEGDLEVAGEKKRRVRAGTNALWVFDLIFALPFLISPAMFNAQAELYWWARYNRNKLFALNAIMWPIPVLFVLIAALQNTRIGRGVRITITPDDAQAPYRSRVRSPRRSPP